jgi:glycerol kinase
MAKSTFGTGGFILMNTGENAVVSKHRLLTTIAYQWTGERAYALEGSIFSAGATVQWLRDGLGLIASAAESGALAAAADPAQRVYLVPAFTGLGAPHWNSEARGAITGLTRGATRKEIVRAALESVAYQTRDLIAAMRADEGASATSPVLRIDGGMSASDWTMQFLADMLDAPVDRPEVLETTALGAAFLAGWRAGVYPGPEEFARSWRVERRFTPAMSPAEREERYAGWVDAIARNIAPSLAG